MRQKHGYYIVILMLSVWSALLTAAPANAVKLGEATYFTEPKNGHSLVPPAPFRTDNLLKTAAQTNQWYSTLLFNAKPEVIYAQPLTFKATPIGLEMSLPSKEVLPTERLDVEIHYPHRDALIISPVAFQAGQARLAKAGDWSIDIDMSRGADKLVATIAHGSPYAYFQISRGDVRVQLPAAAERIEVASDARVLALKVKGKTYALFGSTGVRWERVSDTEWIAHLPVGSGYLTAAALPDDKLETVQLFLKHAYSFIQDTQVSWKYEPANSKVETLFNVTTRTMEGADNGPLLGLYPHQYINNASVSGSLGQSYDTLRGKIRLLAATQFKTTNIYRGFVPYWPGVAKSASAEDLRDLMNKDQRNARRMMLEIGTGPYWQGKGLQRITKLMDVVEQQGDIKGRDQLLKLTKSRIEEWFDGESGKNYFQYDKVLGTVIAYPEEYFSIQQMNDHHFHYGYWIHAMADIALRDPAWAAKDKWGGMTELLIADIATTKRGGADFPFLRNFDVYEGHSWASGVGLGQSGNNQESSSEAINAWAGLILWAEATNNNELRDLGVYLYTTEIESINNYWFDIHQQVLAPEYKNVEVSMLFGGKYSHNTWWTDEPRQIKGINLLPITTASLYMGYSPKYIVRSLDTLKADTDKYLSRGKSYGSVPKDIWQDIFAKYLALADPAAALQKWDRWGSFELGDTRSHALHWMLSLNEMGTPDPEITANTTLYSVFKKANGRRTYLAYNATPAAITVLFSDGKSMIVNPRSLGQAN